MHYTVYYYQTYSLLKGKRNVFHMANYYVAIHCLNIYLTFMSTVYGTRKKLNYEKSQFYPSLICCTMTSLVGPIT